MTEIVVGLDLSPSARAALDWAAEQARATGQTLRAVHVIIPSRIQRPSFPDRMPIGSRGRRSS
jgi:nucleotide-binding universal stress UspA family protein